MVAQLVGEYLDDDSLAVRNAGAAMAEVERTDPMT